MSLFHSPGGYRIPTENLTAEMHSMKTDMDRVKNADKLMEGGMVTLSEEQRRLLGARISGMDTDLKWKKWLMLCWIPLMVMVFLTYAKGPAFLIFLVIIVLFGLGVFFMNQKRKDLVSAYEHNSYQAYNGKITNKKWGRTYGDDAENYFFLVVNGANVKVTKQFYENFSVDEQVLLVILNWESRNYLVLLQCR